MKIGDKVTINSLVRENLGLPNAEYVIYQILSDSYFFPIVLKYDVLGEDWSQCFDILELTQIKIKPFYNKNIELIYD